MDILRTPSVIRETSAGLEHVALPDELFRRRQIFLTDEVNTDSMNALLMQLMYLESEDSDEPVTLYINSPGGSVISGLAVYDYLRLMRRKVVTVCTGIAASMASILFLASDERYMLPHTQIMIHDPSYGGGSIAGLKPDELKIKLDELSRIRDIAAGIIAERTGQPVGAILERTGRDSYFGAEEAVSFGLATGVIRALPAQRGERGCA